MYIILTQCFPSRFGGIESLVSNLALSLGKNHKVLVLADRHHMLHDTIYESNHQEKMTVRRYGGIKFFRRRKKINELKLLIQSQKIQCVIYFTLCWLNVLMYACNLEL